MQRNRKASLSATDALHAWRPPPRQAALWAGRLIAPTAARNRRCQAYSRKPGAIGETERTFLGGAAPAAPGAAAPGAPGAFPPQPRPAPPAPFAAMPFWFGPQPRPAPPAWPGIPPGIPPGAASGAAPGAAPPVSQGCTAMSDSEPRLSGSQAASRKAQLSPWAAAALVVAVAAASGSLAEACR